MQIVPYPHPALLYKSVDVQQIDGVLRRTVSKMFELMYEAKGIGLAANQVGLPFRFFIVNLGERQGEDDEEMVFLNPRILRKKGSQVGEEGCLSLPGLYGDVRRAESLVIEAFDLDGQGFEMDLNDLEARVVQHEGDHLDGILFTDRMREEGASTHVDVHIPKYVAAYQQAQREGLVPPDEEIRRELDQMARSGKIPEDFPDRSFPKIPAPKLE
ncbi:peptide deformylase [Planctomicrobium sp. SH664]|uniref:peptide deformylase n=1 Tax=Planctomicrobium sp. SH664 TaxID=3448125 RepID=UPI003F5C0482